MTSAPLSRFAGLDGLRAIAVLLVVVYHLFPAWMLQSGFIGVDVFFVISGFLITSLLLRERAATGTIALRPFWMRRARRLLPALVLVVTVSATAAWLVGGDVLVGLGLQVAGAATFSYNWTAVVGGASYFAASQPEVFRNLWSLAVEEQFYLLWPLLLPLFLLLRRRWVRVSAALALAAASALWALSSVAAGADITRVYYGTDTHAFGLLLGVALAFALHGLDARRVAGSTAAAPTAAAPPAGVAWRVVAGAVVGAAALVGLCAVAIVAPTDDGATFPGALIVASLLSAVLITVGVQPGSWFGRALDNAPLRWIGERSYGIYLWHWPLVVLVTYAVTGTTADAGVPVLLGVISLVLTLALAELSHRFVEQPVRRYGFRGVWTRLRGRLSSTPARRWSAVAALTAAVLALGGTTAAVAAAPPMTSSEAVVADGQAALDAASPTPAPTPMHIADAALRRDADPLPPECPSVHLSSESGTCVAPDGRPRPPAPAHVDGRRISAVGDSVMLASAQGLLEEFPGIEIDAEVSRSMWAGAGIVQKLAARDALRDYVVVALGTNGPVDASALTALREAVGPDRALVLVNAHAPRKWIPGVNRDLAAFADAHPGIVVADWTGAIADHEDLLAGDGIHPGTAAGHVFADAVAAAVESIENQHAQLTYEIRLAQWVTAKAFPAEPVR